MDRMQITGGISLKGKIRISGSKNTSLAIMPACLLTDEPLILTDIPAVADIRFLRELLTSFGVQVSHDQKTHTLQAKNITSVYASYEIVRKMRASFWVLGPLLARMGQARVSLPGGCAIGARPVDFHLKGLEKLGAKIELVEGYVHASVNGRLKGAAITLPVISVGATMTLMMAATLAEGETVIINAAAEPDVMDLGECLIQMGAKIEGLGTNIVHIQGVERLHGTSHQIIADRIEAGTYAIAAAITGGDITLENFPTEHLRLFIELLKSTGITITEKGNSVRVEGDRQKLTGVDVKTEPYPGFPTDLQAQFMALMTLANGSSSITENIFENRFMHVPELSRMGANIQVQGRTALVRGVPQLIGAPVMATDLRASVSLVLAGLAAQGQTTVSRIYHLDRGFENLEAKLKSCGAIIERTKEESPESLSA